MGKFLKRHKGLHIWFLLSLLPLLVYRIAIRTTETANRFTAVTQAAKDSLGRACSAVRVSVMECMVAILILGLTCAAIWFVVRLVKSSEKWHTLYGGCMAAVCIFLTGWGLYSLMWGVNYHAEGFQEKSGVYAEPVAVEDLDRVTTQFVRNLCALSKEVERDESGVFAVPREDILSYGSEVYRNISEVHPFLYKADLPPKAMAFSKLFSALGFTGFYSPFTGESHLNVDSPACLLPANVAHELGHQRGLASEQECNFLAVAASIQCDSTAYRYSGCLMAYIHLGNALYRTDRERWRELRELLPDEVLADLRFNSAYWEKYEGIASDVGHRVYDTALKACGEERGIRSYGTCVDLLVAYYKNDGVPNLNLS